MAVCGKTTNYSHKSDHDGVRRPASTGGYTRLCSFISQLLSTSLVPAAAEQNLHLNVIPYPDQFVFTSMNKSPR